LFDGFPRSSDSVDHRKEPSMKKLLTSYWTDDTGQGLTEYALIVGLIAIALLLILIAFKDQLGRIYNAMMNTLA
jgi:Flp pilus assembly pilin Flp